MACTPRPRYRHFTGYEPMSVRHQLTLPPDETQRLAAWLQDPTPQKFLQLMLVLAGATYAGI